MVKKRGADQVYLDYGQNGKGKTVVAPYSVRPGQKPYVSTPLTWDEVTDDMDPKHWDITTVPDRLKKLGDLFEPVLSKPQILTGDFNAKEESSK
jgi:bifunctional non-homologous end joining protein LigD